MIIDHHSVVRRFREIALRYPDREAISDNVTSISYGALHAAAAHTALRLRERGIGRGDRVALFFDREPAAFGALLGVLESGGVALPLMASHPGDRIKHIVADAEPSVMLCHSARLREAGAFGVAVIAVDAEAPAAVGESLSLPAEDDPAIILYTSGSSGRPKGVLTAHRALLRKYERVNAVLQIEPTDRLTYFSTIALGQGVNSLFHALLSGATLCPFDVPREKFARLIQWMADRRLTIYASSATLLRSLMRTLDDPRQTFDLRIVRVSGERVLPADVTTAQRVFPRARVIVSYACTEVGPIAMHVTGHDEPFHDGIVPIGKPLEGVTVRILDDEERELPVGEAGEIAVEGHDLPTGYFRGPLPDSGAFRAADGSVGRRRYRTGDLGRMRPDGSLEHRGRKDLRVKIRGFRIEIEEIETVLNQQPDVLRAAVAVKPDAQGDPQLVAYVQRADRSDATIEMLRAQLRLRLAEHMIPSIFVFVAEIPVTESGKVARQQLPDPPADRPALATPCVLPRTPLEEAIASVWREVLGLEAVGIHDAFLSIGGDSLKATLVASRLRSRVGLDVPLVTLFEAATISDLSAAVERRALSSPPTPRQSAP